MLTRLNRIVVVFALTAGMSNLGSNPSRAAQDGKAASKGEPDVTGRWTMTVDTPHGEMAMGLLLKQDGKKVTGTFTNPHGGDMRVEGEFADGTLTLATTGRDEDEESGISFNATLKADGTLSGYVSMQRGDMAWTATRVRSGK